MTTPVEIDVNRGCMNIMSVKRIKISLVDRSSGVPGVFQKRKCLRITIQAVEKATGYSLSMEKEQHLS